MKISRKRLIVAAILVLVAFFSFVTMTEIHSAPEYHADTLQMLDEQKTIAMNLNLLLASTSTALTLLPNDMGTPMANELAELSTTVFVIVCILYSEKFLLTTLAWVACKILIPSACLLSGFGVLFPEKACWNGVKKIVVIAMACLLVIPASCMIANLVLDTFSESVEQAFDSVQVMMEEDTEYEEKEEGNWFTSLLEKAKNTVSSAVEDVADVLDTAKVVLNTAVDSIAVLLFISCILPLLTILAFLWIIKAMLQIDISAGMWFEKTKNVGRTMLPKSVKSNTQKRIEG